MDWIDTFTQRFSSCEMLQRLGEVKFYGKVVINFCEGKPQVVHIKWCVKGDVGADLKDGRSILK